MIAVFDSGVGGLSILRELIAKSVSDSYFYFADQIGFPYGDHDARWIRNRLVFHLPKLIEKNPAGIVIACNTGTVHGIELLRHLTNIPIFGVEPVIKPLSVYNKPLLLATSATLAITKTKGRLLSRAPHGLTMAIENTNLQEAKKILDELARDSELKGIDAIGLSCTHYPLVKNLIQEAFPRIPIIDPSVAVATHVAQTIPPTHIALQGFKDDVEWFSNRDILRLKKQVEFYGF